MVVGKISGVYLEKRNGGVDGAVTLLFNDVNTELACLQFPNKYEKKIVQGNVNNIFQKCLQTNL